MRNALLTLFAILTTLFTVTDVQASHVMAVDLTYECLPNGQYVITLTMYRDCDGITPGTTVNVNFNSASCGQAFSASLPQVGVAQEVSALCASELPNSTCGVGTLPGTEQWTYSDTVTFPAQCADWMMSWGLCCRNSNVTNLTTPASYDLYVEGMINNLNGICNNSPQFSSSPVPYICAGQPFCFNHGAYDPDGDSLAYALAQPLDAAGVAIPYAAGYSVNQPVLTTGPFNFNPATGEMCFTPSGTQTCVIAVEIEEWRNGVLIATHIRELQVVVYACTNQQPYDDGPGIQNVVGGPSVAQTSSNEITMCPGDNVCFEMDWIDPDGDFVTVNDNVAQSIPGATFTTPNNGNSDVLTSTFCYSPTALDTGLNVFTVGIQDDGCPILGGNYYTFSVYVWDETYGGPDQYYCAGGVPPTLSAVGGNTFTWNSLSGDPIIVGTNFSCNPCANPVATPTQTTTYEVVSNLSGSCKNRDTVTVYVVPDFNYTVNPTNTTICLNEIVQLSATGDDPAQGPYTYNWSPAAGLSATNISNPTASPTTSTTYTVTITSAAGCIMEETVQVNVSGVGPTVMMTDTLICPGESVTLDPTIGVAPAVCGLNLTGCTGNTSHADFGTATTASTIYGPFYGSTSLLYRMRHQYIITAAELQAAGYTAGGSIEDIAFYITTVNGNSYADFTVRMGCTALNEFPTGTFVGGLTQTYYAANHTTPGVAGWHTINLNTPYWWDGSSNVIIEVCSNGTTGLSESCRYTSTAPAFRCIYDYGTAALGCAEPLGTRTTIRPNIRLGICQQMPTNPTYSWTPTTSLSDPTILNPVATPGASTTYTLNVIDGASGCTGSGTVTVALDSTNAVVATPDTTICSGDVQLDAIVSGPPPPSTIPCGANGTPVSATYNVQVGNGTLSSVTYSPFYGTYYDTKYQFLYLASDMQAAGMSSGVITELSLNVITNSSTGNFQNFAVGIGCTNESSLSTAVGWLPVTNVWGPQNYNANAGWNTFTLATNFDWDGVSNIVVQFCFDNSTSIGADACQYASAIGYNGTMRYYSNTISPGCNLAATYTYTAVPNIRFEVSPPPPVAWTYAWTPTTGLSDPNISNPLATPPGPIDYVVTVTGGTCILTDTASILYSSSTPPTVNVTDVSCFGANDGQIDITGVGQSPFQYSIDNGVTYQAGNVFTGLSPGTYDISVQDAAGCTSVTTATILEPTQLVATATATDETCLNACDGTLAGSATGGTSPYTYAWNSGAGAGQNINGQCAGSYTLTVTDANGCTATSTATINPGLLVTADFTYNGNQCFATQSFDFTDNSTNATSWSWDFGVSANPATSTAQNPSGVTFSGPGTYPVTLTASNGACTGTTTISVTVYAEPTVTVTGTDATCNGVCDGTLSATPAGGAGGYSYSWDNGPTTATQSNLCPGVYTVTITDLNGCSVQGSYTINEPPVLVATATGADVSCAGTCDGTLSGGASGGTSPYTYVWDNGAGAGQNPAGICEGTYTVTVTDANGCTATATHTIGAPAAMVLTTNGVDAVCGSANGSASVTVVNGASPYSYSWSSGGNNATETGLTAGSYTVTVTDNAGCIATATISINDLGGGTASAAVDANASCNGVCDGQATATMTGGTAPFTYLWSSGGTGATETGLCAGTHSVDITDANGCIASASVTITEPTAIVTTSSSTNTACAAACTGTATANPSGGTPPYSYNWSAGNATTAQTNTGLCMGNVDVTVTDANGCTETITVTINADPTFTVSIAGTDALCNGACDGSADATVNGGTAPFTYVWAHGPTAEDLNGVLCAGTYNLTVTDVNGCSATASVTIAEPAAIVLNAPVITDAVCNGDCNGSIVGGASGGTSPLAYSWVDDATGTEVATTATAVNLCAGNYTLTVTDANGCTATQNATVAEPLALTLVTSGTDANCGQANGTACVSISGGTSPYTQQWNDGSNQTTLCATNLAAGTYTVTVLDAKGCQATATYTINDLGGGSATATVNNNASCNGVCDGSATANMTGGTAPFTYLWSTGNTSQTATGLCAGTHSVDVTDANGCVASATVTITEPPLLAVNMSTNDVSCNGFCDGDATATVIGGTSPYSYSWNNPAGSTSPGISNLCAGTYNLTVTDANGCTTTSTITIGEPTAISLFVSSIDANCGQADGSLSVFVSDGSGVYTSYVWTDAGGNVVGNTQNVSGVPSGTYTIDVTDSDGCTATATIAVGDLVGPTLTLVSQSDVNCNSGNDGTGQVNATGGTSPYTYSWTGGNTPTSENNTGLAAGTYTVTVTDANGCVDNMNITINEPTPVTPSITASTGASGAGLCDGSATADAVGGTAPYTYAWWDDTYTTSAGTGTTATGLCAGTYCCIVTDALGCVDTVCVTIAEPNQITTVLSSTNATCNGVCNGTTTVVASGGVPPYTYQWFAGTVPGTSVAGATNTTASGLCAGNYYVEVTDANGITHTSNVIAVNEPVAITATTAVTSNYNGEDISCNGACDGSAEVVPTGGTPPYTFDWFDATNTPIGQTNQVANNLCAGTYTAEVTDANGCVETFTVTLTEPAALGNSFASTNVSCFGACDGTATATPSGGTPPYTYLWNTPAFDVTATAPNLCAGSYDVTITDANGCSITESVTITEPIELVLTSSSTGSNCGQADGSATVSIVQGVSPFTYQWDANASNQTTATANNLQSGCYDVTVTDANGCAEIINVCVTDLGAPTVSVLSTTDVSCFGGCDGFGQIAVTGGTPPYTYVWMDNSGNPIGQTTASAFNLCAGTYIGQMTDANGCIASISVVINQPVALNAVISNATDVICFGACDGTATVAASGGTAPYTYQWNDPSSQTTATATGLCPGTYTVTVTDANGCTFDVMATIGEPLDIVLSTTTIDAFCNTGTGSATVNITNGTSPYQISWIPGNFSGATVNGLTPNTYTVTVVDANGCTQTSTATVGNIPPGTATISSTTPVSCFGGADGTATVSMGGTGTGPYTYEWFNSSNIPLNQTGVTATGLATGDFYVVVTDANGCVSTSNTATITQPTLLGITIDTFATTCNGACDGEAIATVSGGTPPYSYLWNDPLGQNTDNANGLCAGTYTLTVTDANGCVMTEQAIITEPSAITLTSTTVDANCSQSDGQGCVIASGGTPPYTYLWPDNSTNSCNVGLPAGTYCVTVTDANLCSEIICITINDIAGPSAAIIAITAVSCNGLSDGSATVDMNGGTGLFTVLWDNNAGNQTTPTASGLGAGTYSVTITDAVGCAASTSVTITEPAVLAYTQSQSDPTCFGGCDGTLGITVAGGTSPYTYQWMDGTNNVLTQTGNNVTGLCADNYTLLITDANGCTALVNYVLTDPPLVTGTTSVTNVTCFGACDGTATAAGGIGVVPFTYLWDAAANNQTTATATGLCPGTYTCTITDADGCMTTVSATITEPPLLTTAINTFGHVSCNGVCDGFAQVDVAGGTPPYNYSWNNGSVMQVNSNLCAGSYTVTVTDANGCTSTASITITQPTALSGSVNVVDVSCFDACDGSMSANITGGTPPYTYLWNDPQFSTTMTLNNVCAGSYSVVVTDANGCSITLNPFVSEPTVLDFNATITDANCGQNNGQLCVNVIGGVGPYTYQWNDPFTQTSNCATNLVAGCYTITITDGNGCVLDSLLCVDDIVGPTITFVNSSDVTCNGAANGVVEVLGTGGTGVLTYEWYNGTNLMSATTPLISGLDGGCYTVVVTDAAGCVATETYCITEPSALSAAITYSANVSCNGASDGEATVSVFGGTQPYTYAWNSGAFPSQPNNSGLGAGTFTVTVTDANGCSTTTTVTITEPAPLAITVDNTTDVSCNGMADGDASVTVTGGTAPYLYAWSGGAGSGPLATNLAAGAYTLDVTDANGCVTAVTVTINEPAPLTLASSTINASCTNCNGSGTVIPSGGTSPYTYVWQTGNNINAATNTGLCPGNHTVFVTDANGCSASITMTVNDQPGPQIDSFTTVSPSCNGLTNGSATVHVSGGNGQMSYLWDAAANNQTAQTAVALPAGTYCVTVTDELGCSFSACVTITEPGVLNPVPDIDQTICFGDSASVWAGGQGGTAPYVVNWSTPGMTGFGPITVLPTVTTDYCFTVTDANGCISPQGCVTITVTPELDLDVTPSTSICDGDDLPLSATGTGGNGDPYNFNWFEGSYPGGANIHTESGVVTSSLTVNPTADTWYYVLLDDGCTTPVLDSVLVSINALPIAFLNVQDSADCIPFAAQFTLNSDIGVQFDWDFDCDGVIDLSGSDPTPQWTYTVPGTYTVCVTVTSADGCVTTLTATNMVTAYDVPVADFTMTPPQTTILNPTIVFTDASVGGTWYEWNFGDGTIISGDDDTTFTDGSISFPITDPVHTYSDTGMFVVTLTIANDAGCTSTISYSVYIEGDYILFAPSAFTPNGDGKNDFFYPQGIGISDNGFEMYIFDRWGEVVFESHNVNNAWDGTIRGTGIVGKTDVYVWLIRTVDHNGDSHQYLGHVTLLR